ncbi:MAG: hypothetical protein FJ213_10905 [Ignavibacteria bacterium]|nr:hypothetical protein [Ignavibacteria bacterium]
MSLKCIFSRIKSSPYLTNLKFHFTLNQDITVNRYSGKNDREPDHVYWNAHWASKWVDVNPLTKNWELTRDVMGDENDAFNLEYNNLLTPWSNPATTNNISLQIVSQNGNTITVKAYSQSASGLALPPSKPQNLTVFVNGNYPSLTWTANIEPDVVTGGKYKIYRATTTGGAPSSFSYITWVNSSQTSWIDSNITAGSGS